MTNIDPATVDGFGDEWDAYDQTALNPAEHMAIFDAYFSVFPFTALPSDAEGFDLGCGSGRWAATLAPRVGVLHCIDPSEKALAVARRRLGTTPNVYFHHAGSDAIPLEDGSQDFGYSLGVLHHIPDTTRALENCVRKLKPGAPFLLYVYYRFDDRSRWFRGLWRATDIARRCISRMPFFIRRRVTSMIAFGVYLPFARYARHADRKGRQVSELPLSAYRNSSFYTMRTDALDRFGTRLEQRFTRPEIAAMMATAGLEDVIFRDGVPYWVACGSKAT